VVQVSPMRPHESGCRTHSVRRRLCVDYAGPPLSVLRCKKYGDAHRAAWRGVPAAYRGVVHEPGRLTAPKFEGMPDSHARAVPSAGGESCPSTEICVSRSAGWCTR